MNSWGSCVSSSFLVVWMSCSGVGVVSSSWIIVRFVDGCVGVVCCGCGVLRFWIESLFVVV